MKKSLKRERPRLISNLGASEENPGKTHQSMRDECDINKILAVERQTGLVNHVNSKPPRYEDLSGATDYKTSMDIVMAAKEAFSSLPAGIRRDFDNDPYTFLEFCENPDNQEELIEMGLADKPSPEIITPDAVQAEPETEKPDPKSEPVTVPD